MFRCFPGIPLPKVLDPDHRLLRLCQLIQLSLSSTVSWPGCFRGAIENNHKTIARRGCLFRTPLTGFPNRIRDAVLPPADTRGQSTACAEPRDLDPDLRPRETHPATPRGPSGPRFPDVPASTAIADAALWPYRTDIASTGSHGEPLRENVASCIYVPVMRSEERS